jgi:opacity protein-like surface antigen
MTRTWLALLLALAAVPDAAAQAGQAPGAAPDRPTPDFLFGEPRGSIGLRGSWVFARARSDVFDFVRTHLTIDRGAFDAPGFAADVAFTVTPRVDAVAGFEFSQASSTSEYRAFVDNNRQPIEQTTRLRAANLSASLRVALAPRGTRVSRLAWVPRRVTPYVGAGGGAAWYELSQAGDFVDVGSRTMAVFSDVISSTGWTPSAHAFGGVDVRVHRRTFVTIEGRYLWAAADLGRRFEGFDPIDLAGLRLSAGVNVLF